MYQICNDWGDSMNANMLRAKIKVRGLTQGEVAHLIGLSDNSFSRKILGKRDFRLSEVSALCDVLDIDNAQEIFLPRASQKCNDTM